MLWFPYIKNPEESRLSGVKVSGRETRMFVDSKIRATRSESAEQKDHFESAKITQNGSPDSLVGNLVCVCIHVYI